MNPVQIEISKRLRKFPSPLKPIRDAASRFLRYCSTVDIHETIQIAHQPWVACEGYAIRLFPPPPRVWLARFLKEYKHQIPAAVRTILSATNGAFLFDISLFGFPPSLMQKPPLLDRSRAQCHALQLANSTWKWEYHVDPAWFHFGGGVVSYSENSGYFVTGDDEIVAVRTSGEVLRRWTSLPRFLADELRAAEARVRKGTPTSWWH